MAALLQWEYRRDVYDLQADEFQVEPAVGGDAAAAAAQEPGVRPNNGGRNDAPETESSVSNGNIAPMSQGVRAGTGRRRAQEPSGRSARTPPHRLPVGGRAAATSSEAPPRRRRTAALERHGSRQGAEDELGGAAARRGRRDDGRGRRRAPWYVRPLLLLLPFLRDWGGFM